MRGVARAADQLARRADDESGVIAGGESLAFGVLIFVIGTLIVVNAWGVVDAKLAALAAAREATRVFVEAPAGSVAAAEAAAVGAARAALHGHGKDPARMQPPVFDLAGLGASGDLARCARVTTEVRYRVPTVRLPWVGWSAAGIEVVARHSEIVDPFRSGLPGEAACDF